MKNFQVVHSTQQIIPKHLKMSNYSYFYVFGFQKFRNCHNFVKMSMEICIYSEKRKRIYSERFQKDTMDPVFRMHLVLSLFMLYFLTYGRFCSAKYCFYTVSVLSERFNALISNIISEIVDTYLPK